LTSVLFLIMMLVEQANGRFWLNDFKVFYSAAEALLSGNEVYGVVFGLETGYYKYSPFTLLLFIPFTFLPYSIAAGIHFWVIVSATIGTFVVIYSIANRYLTKGNGFHLIILLFGLIVILNHLIRELHLGNTNMILLFVLSLSAHLGLAGKERSAGLLLGIAILTKPYFLLLGLPLLLIKNWKWVASTAFAVIAFIMISITFLGFENGVLQYKNWLDSMAGHSSYLTSSHTINSLLETYFGIALPEYSSYGMLILFSLGFCWLIHRVVLPIKKQFVLCYFVIIALIPNFLVTDTEHFLFTLPLILFSINEILSSKRYLFFLPLIIAAAFYLGNSSDLLGKDLSNTVNRLGLLGISNLLLIGITAWLLVSSNLGFAAGEETT